MDKEKGLFQAVDKSVKKTLLSKRNQLLQNQLKKQEAERKEYRYVE
nr:hypothetical protein [Bacteroides hominis (ex Liu et al. 2022)]MDV6133294.1 hypothetical protein [Bacteroides hominis (ex Liu et al. 2022)]